MKYVFTIGIPIFVIFLQVFLKFLCDVDLTTNLGITIGAIGLGQIFPFIAFENLLLTKIFRLKEEPQLTTGGFKVEYTIEQISTNRSIDKMKGMAFGILLLSIVLFMVVVTMSSYEQSIFWRVGLGIVNCIITWAFILTD